MSVRLTARVPATSANLGPGFDCFGLALDLCNEVTVDTEAEPGVTWEGEGADELPTDGTDLISRAIRHVQLDAEGSFGGEFPLPAFHLHGVNRIPLERGLGSSSAATVAGIVLGSRLLDVPELRDDPVRWLSLASQMEGHPDNAAAAVFGGFVIIAGADHVRLEPHPQLRPVLLIPGHVRLPTAEARRALPSTVSFEDAVHEIGRAAFTVVALTREPTKLLHGLDDRLHEAVRLAFVPEVREVFERLREASVPVCVSGAGPTLLAFETDGRPVPDPGEGWRVLHVAPRRIGVDVAES